MTVEMYSAWFGILGLLIGSFLNVVIYRVPNGVSVSGRSHCPGCSNQIAVYDNIPVFSWVVLRGKCRNCKMRISARYPLIEGSTGVAFAVVAWNFLPNLPLTVTLLIFMSVSIALFMIDADTLRLPDVIVIPTFFVLSAGFLVTAGVGDSMADLLRGLVAALALGAAYFTLWFITSGRGLGFGDVKLAPSLGLVLGFFGWGPVAIGTAAAWLLGAVVGVAGMALGKMGRGKPIPFGPFLIVGTWVGVFFGEQLSALYLKMFGLA